MVQALIFTVELTPRVQSGPRGSASSEPLQEPSSVTARLQHLRELLLSEAARGRDLIQQSRALDTLDRELQELDSDLMLARLAEHRRQRLGYERDRRDDNSSPALIQSGVDQDRRSTNPPTSSSRPRRPRVNVAEEMARVHERRRNATVDGLNGLQQAAARLTEASSSVNALLDEPIPQIGSPSLSAQEYSVEAQANRWRAKRRKLDSDDRREGIRGFSYGHFGQVVSGALEMEIVSCDGGTYETNGESSWPENVLINDSSVYCTKSDRCNLILGHRGEIPFCLKKIVIKAP